MSKFDKIDMQPVMTVLMLLLAVIIVGVGGVKVIVDDDGYSFAAYLDDLKTFAIALGALGVGRGILSGLSNLATGINLPEPRDEEMPQEVHATGPIGTVE